MTGRHHEDKSGFENGTSDISLRVILRLHHDVFPPQRIDFVLSQARSA